MVKLHSRVSMTSSSIIQDGLALLGTSTNNTPNLTKGGNSLGVLYTGWMEKRNPVTGSYHTRFMVLTNEAVHWFIREEGYDLFGEERGRIGLETVLNVRVHDDNSSSCIFLLQSIDGSKRTFRCQNQNTCEEWVSAIRSALKMHTMSTASKGIHRRASLSNINSFTNDSTLHQNGDYNNGGDVTILLVSIKSAVQGTEIVIARNPLWDRMIHLMNVNRNDLVIVSTSTGGTVSIPVYTLHERAKEGYGEFEVSIQHVALASSLRITAFEPPGVWTQTSGTCRSNRSNSIKSDVMGTSNSVDRNSSSINSFINRDDIFMLFNSIVNHHNNAVSILLCTMLVFVAAASTPYLNPRTVLLYVLAVLLAIHACYSIIKASLDDDANKRGRGYSLVITLNGHSFTSPDAPVNEDDVISQRFIIGCNQDLEEARRRWDITKHWRDVEGVDNILEEQQPNFSLIKTMYPHYHAGKGKEGHVVFYERPGDLELPQLNARGIKLDDLLRHWLFVTEYQWKILLNNNDEAKSIAVIDIENVKMADAIAGEGMEYLKKTIGIANAHYPERSYLIFIVNAPSFFSWVWSMIKPFINVNTQKKIHILSKKQTLEGLSAHIDLSQIPVYYGGGLNFGGHDSCRFNSPEVMDLNSYVANLNDQFQQRRPFSDNISQADISDASPQSPINNVARTAHVMESSSSSNTALLPNGNRYRLMSTSA